MLGANPNRTSKFIREWCNGSTTVFGTVCLGSNPSPRTILSFDVMQHIGSDDVSLKDV